LSVKNEAKLPARDENETKKVRSMQISDKVFIDNLPETAIMACFNNARQDS